VVSFQNLKLLYFKVKDVRKFVNEFNKQSFATPQSNNHRFIVGVTQKAFAKVSEILSPSRHNFLIFEKLTFDKVQCTYTVQNAQASFVSALAFERSPCVDTELLFGYPKVA
tara:strand:+ start:157 stop:489 length:333 start_codon:yes stop_codon:yes gene_type:complete